MKLCDTRNWLHSKQAIGQVYFRSSVRGRNATTSEATDPLEWAAVQTGNWAAVITTPSGATHMITDAPRSFPILYTVRDGELIVSSSPSALIENLHQQGVTPQLNSDAAAEFRHVGYVFGTDTLIGGVSTVPAASVATFSDGQIQTASHLNFLMEDRDDINPKAALDEFFQNVVSAFDKLIQDANGRQLVIPLSGGADSRLLAAIFKKLNPPNVLAYSYGISGSTEAKISQQVAAAAGIDWVFVEFSPEEIAAQWYCADLNPFIEHTWSGNALPHIQDWFAVKQLHETGKLEPGAIFVPGHTVVGNTHDDWLYQVKRRMSVKEIVTLVGEHHSTLQGKSSFAVTNAYTRKKIVAYVRSCMPLKSSFQQLQITASFNMMERQAKYINNSMRTYEYFGYDWALPMLERKLIELWLSAPIALQYSDRKLYIDGAQQLFMDECGTDLGYFGGIATALPQRSSSLIKTVLTTTHLSKAANRANAALVQMRHPMAFQAFTRSATQPKLLAQLLKGGTLLGAFCDDFLARRWIPNQQVPPS